MDGATEHSSIAEEILSRLPAGWDSIFPELAALSGAQLAALLRPRIEEVDNTRTTQDADLITRLDNGLHALSLLELGAAAGGLPLHISDAVKLPARLSKSQAFGRYVNNYLYFGVRFLADRLGEVADWEQDSQCNLLPFALKHPPDLINPQNITNTRMFLEASGAYEEDSWAVEAMHFLDDFHDQTVPGEEAAYELWLLHLPAPEGCEEHFTNVTTGLLEWIRKRVAVYAQLEGRGSLPETLPSCWMAHNPLT
ncbi:MAG: hypothetical protein JWN34_1212, partial [Bryobacterales bacterium]|nr:hypothetical protein [Bryobacterales bacterium]